MNTEQQPTPRPPADPAEPSQPAPADGAPEQAAPASQPVPADGVPASQPAPGQDAPQDPPPSGPPPAGWGAPPPPPSGRSRWSVLRTVIAVVAAVAIGAAGGVAIYAASTSTHDDRGGGPGGMRANGPVMGGPMADTDHGEFQNGEVTAISDDSITAKSDDGYTRTYTIDSDTMRADGIEKGDDVMIVATTSDDDKATATMITEPGQGMRPPGRDGQLGPPNNRDNN